MPPLDQLININIWILGITVVSALILTALATREAAITIAVGFYAFCTVLTLSFWFWVIYVAVHFIQKYW